MKHYRLLLCLLCLIVGILFYWLAGSLAFGAVARTNPPPYTAWVAWNAPTNFPAVSYLVYEGPSLSIMAWQSSQTNLGYAFTNLVRGAQSFLGVVALDSSGYASAMATMLVTNPWPQTNFVRVITTLLAKSNIDSATWQSLQSVTNWHTNPPTGFFSGRSEIWWTNNYGAPQ